jgi:hypothetical protein
MHGAQCGNFASFETDQIRGHTKAHLESTIVYLEQISKLV